MTDSTANIHATTVSIEGQGVLIIGASGSGKSSLAVQLIALGAVLVADDQTLITSDGQIITATAPGPIAGMIEARGVGVLYVDTVGPTPVDLVIDLDQQEAKRLPDPHTHQVLDVMLPCLHKSDRTHFASAILLYIKSKQKV